MDAPPVVSWRVDRGWNLVRAEESLREIAPGSAMVYLPLRQENQDCMSNILKSGEHGMSRQLESVVKRSGAIVPFNRERISNAIYRAAVAVGGRDRERADWLADQVVEYLMQTLPDPTSPTIEQIQDAVEKILIENGHAQVSKAFILYRDERDRSRREQSRRSMKPSGNVPWRKIWYVLDWAVQQKLDTVQSLNQRVRAGEFPHIVHESEAAYEDDLDTAAEILAERGDSLRIVLITGPSSSGKTTTTIKLDQRLSKRGLKFRALNIDNYFFDLELHPKDEFGDYDFETPQALDLALVNEHLKALVAGQKIMIPFYDFKTGQRTDDQTPMKLENNEILLIDSLHGLYPPMTEGIDPGAKASLYLETLLQMRDLDGEYIRWTDLRLIRRMLRDSVHRAYDPQRTLEHWHYVRASELRNIVPYQGTADFIINSAMPYELCLYRDKLLDDFARWESLYQGDPLREDALMRAARVHKLLETIEPVTDESSIPADSVLREFIGGSSLEY
jgi:uridine kinase